jgi:hypothetical protein
MTQNLLMIERFFKRLQAFIDAKEDYVNLGGKTVLQEDYAEDQSTLGRNLVLQ